MSLENYDPNLTSSGNMAKQTVELTFQQWQFSTTRTVTVGGNCTGLSVIETAIENVYDTLPTTGYDAVYIELTDADQGELIVEDLDERDYDWLNSLLVSARITAIEPAAKD